MELKKKCISFLLTDKFSGLSGLRGLVTNSGNMLQVAVSPLKKDLDIKGTVRHFKYLQHTRFFLTLKHAAKGPKGLSGFEK